MEKMKRTYIKEVKEAIDEELFLKGWIHKISDLGQLTFIMLRDKTGIIQLVFEKGAADHLRLEMSIEVKGKECSMIMHLEILRGLNYMLVALRC